jgi:hypothetical protein
MEKVTCSEIQRFRQWWVWAIIILVDAGLVVAIVLDKVYGANHNEEVSVFEFVGIAVVSALPTTLFISMNLKTRIDGEGVHVRFFPFHFTERHYHWRDISKAYVRNYSPLWEYGGWGIKYGSGGKAFNVSGNQGLQLELSNGEKLLIGTLKPEVIAVALKGFGYGEQ